MESDLFKLPNDYETKLLLDRKTLNKDYVSYYVDENKPETKFYLYDELILHAFLNQINQSKI